MHRRTRTHLSRAFVDPGSAAHRLRAAQHPGHAPSRGGNAQSRLVKGSIMMVVDVRDMPSEQWRQGVETRMLVSASNGAAQLCIFEQWIAPGAGAPTHSHPVEEVLTVREGEAEMWMDEQRLIVSVGQSLIVPAGRKHGFRSDHGRRDGNGAAMGCRVSASVVGFRSLDRHARPCAGHPRLTSPRRRRGWPGQARP
jgi:quercetin dioxygenase-like cupin family protein